MRTSGLIFMLASWGSILYLTVFCICKVLKSR